MKESMTGTRRFYRRPRDANFARMQYGLPRPRTPNLVRFYCSLVTFLTRAARNAKATPPSLAHLNRYYNHTPSPEELNKMF